VCQCKHYMLYHICSHTISASHINMTLYDMVMWHRRKFKSRVSSKVLCQTTDTHRSGLKANQTNRKRKSKNTVQESPTIKSTIDCQTDHKSVPRLVYIKNHTTVTKCHICEMDIPTASDLCIGEYVMSRSYRDKSSKKLKMSFKKQWAYSHLQCFDNKREVHICLPIAQNHKSELKRNKITVIGDIWNIFIHDVDLSMTINGKFSLTDMSLCLFLSIIFFDGIRPSKVFYLLVHKQCNIGTLSFSDMSLCLFLSIIFIDWIMPSKLSNLFMHLQCNLRIQYNLQ
jgi:hypothetical protein